ncbi:hypothetical protein [Luteipulveratus halotolerans]|uniref:DUF305 domain-containing protein n=1 Tax=Luteipulveratus halotolerans TaxID=1631356 RepID=A0A0L6CMC6_9MICO|nr:hypothetical protein [Luteipulveratus halotolerans]KNX38688.1 hypothetical protein VV01_18535 [Luteipulveratus halotolerans]
MSRRAGLVVLTAVLLTGGCVTPAPDSGAFRQNARGAVESGISETSTAVLVVRQTLHGRLTGPVSDTALSDAEDAMGPIEDSFGKVQPPHASDDALRDLVGGQLGDAEDAIADARIATRRDDEPALRQALKDLTAALAALHKTQDDLG